MSTYYTYWQTTRVADGNNKALLAALILVQIALGVSIPRLVQDQKLARLLQIFYAILTIAIDLGIGLAIGVYQ